MPQALSTDILIVGGGIAGLWLNARLRRAGYATVLVESASLGGGQSVKSQGIIHGGAKYALHGVEQAKGDDLPPALRDKGFKGKAYRLTEIVFDVPDLIRRLAELAGDSLLAGQRIEALREGEELAGLRVDGREIRAQRVVLSAGAGNQALLRELGLEQPAMQRRPLHMVMVKAKTLKPLYAHCLGAGPKPRITVTTHPTRDGQAVWYLGGDIAEADGVARDEAAQIAEARRELAKLLPWIDLGQARWATLRVDRAEPAQSNLLRPDNAFLAEQGRLLVGWPTKLALAPDFADRVCARLEEEGIRPGGHVALPELPRPPLAEPAWEVAFQ